MKTEALKQALDAGKYDAAIGGARRDEEKSRAKERIFSHRSKGHVWDPKNQRPELWSLYNTRINPDESLRVFPLSNWTETDIWAYIYMQDIPMSDLYLAAERPVVERDGALFMLDDDRFPLNEGEKPQMRSIRFRTLGCYPLTAAIESTASTLAEVIIEMRSTHYLRAFRQVDRQRPVRLHGKEEKGGVLLMSAANKAQLDMQQFIEMESSKSMLKFITCGSVDDGKSTLIGRLLYDSQLLYDDQLEELKRDSKGRLSTEEDIDFSLLVDGLAAEREQGITIDVAYRFFSTSKRKFIVADTPGHEQYTRNMATGASTAEAAVLLIDARLGVSTQTRRHAYILSLVGVKHIVLAINKIDLKDYSRELFEDICAEFEELFQRPWF